ncbi:M81 family metallopeptidase [Tessaracoccus sp. MC1756]|uniref:M81 family metallopeptidase n=1 Tax=Tessaracoccus sp. MC1756 TaxID=2760311 RepID=UPI0016045C82|nr:M81 family metallopeptidase [Tessaracoccus sp. MC1756]MBB1510468.1 M81 family metallopeptidase [Tessaracoccus sp. MC1756]
MREASEIRSEPLPPVALTGISQPRVGVGGIAIESSTFSRHVATLTDFVQRRGEELLAYHPFLREREPLRQAAHWVPLLHGRSLPGGPVAQEAYLAMRDELVERIQAEGPFDGFLLDIHGAMSVVGMLDAEGDLARAVRAALGRDTLVSASMDLHGNVSPEFLAQVDLVTCYRMAPHEDEENTRERAARNLLARLRADGGSDPESRRPLKAWVRVPILLPGEKTSTRVEPARSLYRLVPQVEARDGVLDAAIWVGYAWADEPRCHGVVVVTGDAVPAVRYGARQLAEAFWAVRDEFEFVGPTGTFAEAIDIALSPDAKHPHVVSDSGDNPTAGGAGDSSWSLTQLIADPRLTDDTLTVIHASINDAAAVAAAAAAGVGARVQLRVGGNVDEAATPAQLDGIVRAVVEGDPVGGTQVVVQRGAVHAIISERRKPFHHLADFTRLGLDPRDADIVVVKIGYLEPELHDLAEGWTLALTPGGVDQNLERLGHHRLLPGTWPFATNGLQPMFEPQLSRGAFPC